MDTQNPRKHFNYADLIEKIGDDKEFIETLYTTYLEGFEQYFGKIKEAITTFDQIMLKNNAHALKGSSYSACFEMMGDIIYEIEKCDVKQNEYLQMLSDKVDNEIQLIDIAVKNFLKST
jgi:HPt (histidine-containing phosphotransfer) domain-containing protein